MHAEDGSGEPGGPGGERGIAAAAHQVENRGAGTEGRPLREEAKHETENCATCKGGAIFPDGINQRNEIHGG